MSGTKTRSGKKQGNVCMEMHFKLRFVVYVNWMLHKNVIHVVINNMKIDNFVIAIRQLEMKFMRFCRGASARKAFLACWSRVTSSWCNFNLIFHARRRLTAVFVSRVDRNGKVFEAGTDTNSLQEFAFVSWTMCSQKCYRAVERAMFIILLQAWQIFVVLLSHFTLRSRLIPTIPGRWTRGF